MEHYFHIDYKFSHYLEIENHEFPNVDEIQGEIFYNGFEKDPTKIGNIELHFYNYSFIDYGFNLYQAFDRSSNTIKLGDAILDYETGELKKEIEDKIGLSFISNILVIQEFMIYPQYRNKGYGKEILNGIETFHNGRCGYIALQSYPKQHDIILKNSEQFNEFGLENLNKNYKSSQKQLDSFYENCGFHKIQLYEESYFIKNIYPM